MYTPPHNRQDDPDAVLAFMREFSFATLVSAGEGGITATHAPLAVSREGDSFRISGHIAKANQQAVHLATGVEAMAIFAEPHAYISPDHYEPGRWVPTWNYIAVHAYGVPALCDSREARLAILAETIAANDPGYQAAFDAYPPEFIDAKLKGIVAFEMRVSRIDARWKLSQDRKPVERERIANALRQSADQATARLAAYMEDRTRAVPAIDGVSAS